jgi:hypothetical protein
MILHFIAGLLWSAALIFAAMYKTGITISIRDPLTVRVFFVGAGLAVLLVTLQVLA